MIYVKSVKACVAHIIFAPAVILQFQHDCNGRHRHHWGQPPQHPFSMHICFFLLYFFYSTLSIHKIYTYMFACMHMAGLLLFVFVVAASAHTQKAWQIKANRGWQGCAIEAIFTMTMLRRMMMMMTKVCVFCRLFMCGFVYVSLLKQDSPLFSLFLLRLLYVTAAFACPLATTCAPTCK